MNNKYIIPAHLPPTPPPESTTFAEKEDLSESMYPQPDSQPDVPPEIATDPPEQQDHNENTLPESDVQPEAAPCQAEQENLGESLFVEPDAQTALPSPVASPSPVAEPSPVTESNPVASSNMDVEPNLPANKSLIISTDVAESMDHENDSGTEIEAPSISDWEPTSDSEVCVTQCLARSAVN